MINGLGVVGWGVGGIEAEAGMLGPAGDVSGAGSGRRAPDRRAAAGRDGDRPRAARHRTAAEDESGRQIRGVLRPRRRALERAGPRDDREHGAGVRRDDGILWHRRSDHRLSAGHGAQRGAVRDGARTISRRRGCGAFRRAASIDYTQVVELDLSTVKPGRRRSEAPAGPHRSRCAEAEVERILTKPGAGRVREDKLAGATGSRWMKCADAPAGVSLERSAADRGPSVENRAARSRISGMGRRPSDSKGGVPDRRSRTAACSSRPSPVARIPPIPA